MRNSTVDEAIRFAVVGVVSNGVLYLLYLAARHLGLQHTLAMTVAFVVGVAQTFVANRSWSFRSRAGVAPTFVRYVIVYLMAYLLNLTASIIFVDYLGFEDRLVQAFMVCLIAVLLFAAQKLWVFRSVQPRCAIARGRP
ncbi:MAG TPA: GtrA family protein [Trinickia sp.]|uniref:GtrA family protein n=1 Tax=Trinickia sp. TaxID=2571163 RepID=UPI002C497E3A|nr:GtrA family protein [Trinickia sp.]HVW52317.1 GtrA family protein [Trinickia sp.]